MATPEKIYLKHSDIHHRAQMMADKIRVHLDIPTDRPLAIYGVPRGGIPVAYYVANFFEKATIAMHPDGADVIVDDIIDSGKTMERYAEQFPHTPFLALYNSSEKTKPCWLVFPWEQGEGDESATDIPLRLLQYIGENPEREGLQETPKRFLKAWDYWAGGYSIDPQSVLKTFEDGSENIDEMVFVGPVPFTSHCEHHLAQFSGVVFFGYVPNGKIVGLSKIPRLIDIFARRLQVQERLTTQIAESFFNIVQPLGVGVITIAEHTCISSRGVKLHSVETKASKLLGVFKDNPSAKQEFLQLIQIRLRD